MSNINIINGDGRYVKDCISKVLEPAIQYYGDKYSKVVEDTVKNIYFYEWEENQEFIDVFEELGGKIVLDDEVHIPEYMSNGDNAKGYFIKNRISNDRIDDIVIFRNKILKRSYHNLVHETFGHGVYGHVDCHNFVNGMEYERNGISVLNRTTKKRTNNIFGK